MSGRLVFLTGVSTAKDFLEPLRSELASRFLDLGREPSSLFHMPYGDWSRSLLRQLEEVRQDIPWRRYREDLDKTRSRRSRSSFVDRAAQLADVLIADGGEDGPLILIGHSAGGIVAVQAARRLYAKGLAAIGSLFVVQIGSPKIPVPRPLAESTLYLYGITAEGRPKDPIARLGWWGGWERGRTGLPWWNPRLYAPGRIQPVPLIGKHADYFRSKKAYCDAEGRSNLDWTVSAIMDFINPIK